MPRGLLEAVPNFSEGTDESTLSAIGAAIEDGGAYLADVHRDVDHNRSVFTLFGTADALRSSLHAAVATAVERIDLNAHEGVHPRVGACDVLPIVPLRGFSERGGDTQEAVALARELASSLGTGFQIPTILYGIGATEEAAFAGSVRVGGRAGLQARLAAGQLQAHGGADLHPTAGAMLVGARDVLIAFNVVLQTDNLDLAREIAAQVRERGGGLPGVRALALPLQSRGLVQVSTNVERYREAGAADVLQRVTQLAIDAGSHARECELVGLAPAAEVAAVRATGVELRAAGRPALEDHLQLIE